MVLLGEGGAGFGVGHDLRLSHFVPYLQQGDTPGKRAPAAVRRGPIVSPLPQPAAHDEQEHRIDRDRLYAVILVFGLISGGILIAAGYQFFLPLEEGRSLPGRVSLLGGFAFACSLPVWYHLLLFRYSIVRRPDGLVFRVGSREDAVSWDDVAELYYSEQFSDLFGTPSETLRREFGGQRNLRLRLVTTAGRTYRVDNTYRGVEPLCRATIAGVLASLRARAEVALRRGDAVAFGPVSLNAEGLTVEGGEREWWHLTVRAVREYLKGIEVHGSGHLAFAEVGSIRAEVVTRGPATYHAVVIRERGRKKPWALLPVPEMPNFDLFAELLARFGH